MPDYFGAHFAPSYFGGYFGPPPGAIVVPEPEPPVRRDDGGYRRDTSGLARRFFYEKTIREIEERLEDAIAEPDTRKAKAAAVRLIVAPIMAAVPIETRSAITAILERFIEEKLTEAKTVSAVLAWVVAERKRRQNRDTALILLMM